MILFVLLALDCAAFFDGVLQGLAAAVIALVLAILAVVPAIPGGGLR